LRAIRPSRSGSTSTAVPLEELSVAAGRARRPLAGAEVVRDVEAARREAHVGPALEDPGEVRANRLGADDGLLAGGVVLEDDVVGVRRDDRVEILGVPAGVVTLEQLTRIRHANS
jgi:hypothetical protein